VVRQRPLEPPIQVRVLAPELSDAWLVEVPELPEVETIRRGLLPRIVGLPVQRIEVGDRKVFQSEPSRLEAELPGQSVQALWRRGKFLVFDLDRSHLVVHLGMTGQLTLRDPRRADDGRFLRSPLTGLERARQHAPDRHTHLQVHFLDGRTLMLRDTRKFGKVHLVPRNGSSLEQLFSHLGCEPLSNEYQLASFLEKMSRRPRVQIKSLLLDQKFVAGIGNIYADEALFEAGIRPTRRVRSLRRYEKVRLFESIPRVLEKGIAFGGTSLRDYVDSNGEAGHHQEELNVYGRNGNTCRRCETTIVKIVVGQRGTHFCPRCQPTRPQGRSKAGSTPPVGQVAESSGLC
jgi:formamidopyrimidine-DNA glycosylase